MIRLIVAVLILAAAAISVHAEDWPQFRGPTGQGHSAERGLPLAWSETRNVGWKTPVAGVGWSSPVVAGGRVWVTTAIDSGNPGRGPVSASLRVLAFDVATGREVVNVELFRPRDTEYIHPKNSRASPTPVLEGDRVYVHFGAEGTAALTTSGEIVWKTSRRKPADQAYTTPLVIRVGDRDQVVSVGAYRAVAYDPLTGREIWRVGYPDGFSNVPRPVFGHGLVYIVTGFNEPTLIAVRADGQGDVTRTHIVWTLERGVPFTPSPLLVGDELYVLSDIGILSCLDARTGATIWQARLGGNYSASPVFADGRMYFQSEEGVVTVVAPGKEFRRLATSRLDGGMLASMAISGGSIFIRTETHLYRIRQM